jgi:putative ABC transport system ATP-binding protein
MNENPIIEMTDVVKTYQLEHLHSTILKNIDLKVYPGDLLAIVGASGSGKSTLMNIIGLLDKSDSGSYLLGGKAVASLTSDELAILRNQKIGFVFQQFNLLPRFNVVQNVALPLTYRHLAKHQIKEKVYQVLEKVGMQAYVHHRPTQLSGGQQQRIAIARALVTEPDVILADEPTGALDSKTGADVMNLFLHLNQEGKTIIIVTHDSKVAGLCRRVITLSDGAILPLGAA